MRFFLRITATFKNDVWQRFLKLLAIHDLLSSSLICPAAFYLRAALSALLSFNKSRNFNIAQYEDNPVPWRQAFNGPLQIHPVNRPCQHVVTGPNVFPGPIFMLRLQGFVQRNFRQPLFPQVHQYHVYRQPVQPGRKSRLSAKGGDLAVELQESFLSKIFRLGRIAGHAQAERVHPSLMKPVKGLKTLSVTLLRPFNRFSFRQFGRDHFPGLCQMCPFKLCTLRCVRVSASLYLLRTKLASKEIMNLFQELWLPIPLSKNRQALHHRFIVLL